MRLNAGARTDVGQIRTSNEDAFVLRPESGVFAVADGMGGHAAGEVASRLAAEVIVAFNPGQRDGGKELESALAAAAATANRTILEDASRFAAHAGMGTTLTAVAVSLPSATMVCAHVGDSRLYRLRAGQLTQLTRDHTWVQEQIDGGTMPPGAARDHPYASALTRALGTDPNVRIDSFSTDLKPGDRYLLCSDGLTGMLRDDQIRSALSARGGPDAVCERLIQQANDAGGRDNITAVVVEITS